MREDVARITSWAPISRDILRAKSQQLLDGCLNLLAHKGKEYSGNEDCLGNFRRLSTAMGLEPETILNVYMTKHWDSIQSFIRHLQKTGEVPDIVEPIDSRIMDMINYLILLRMAVYAREAQLEGNSKIFEAPAE